VTPAPLDPGALDRLRAYRIGKRALVLVGQVALCAAIEVIQLEIPGRHGRLSDFLVLLAWL
jgi:hypothetical protein